ncbi:MAG: nucleotidyltransferase domain-containing protein [Candidatus Bipolaricaulia bacterium]
MLGSKWLVKALPSLFALEAPCGETNGFALSKQLRSSIMTMGIKSSRSAELERYLEGEREILALYLFGSHSEGVTHVRSDVDLALLLAPKVDKGRYFEYRLRYLSGMRKFFRGKLDLIILNQVPPLLQFQVLKKGQLIFDRDSDVRAEFEMKMLSRYYLSTGFYKFHFTHLIRRIKEEGLGRGSQSHRGTSEEVRRISEKFSSL